MWSEWDAIMTMQIFGYLGLKLTIMRRLMVMVVIWALVSSVQAASIYIPDLKIRQGEEFLASLSIRGLSDKFDYKGIQFDVILPEGINMIDAIESEDLSDFTVDFREVSPNIYRVMALNISGSSSATNLMTLTFRAESEIKPNIYTIYIEDPIFSSPNGQDIHLEDSSAAITVEKASVSTGVSVIEAPTSTIVYTLDGKQIKNPSSGIYIINGRKILK